MNSKSYCYKSLSELNKTFLSISSIFTPCFFPPWSVLPFSPGEKELRDMMRSAFDNRDKAGIGSLGFSIPCFFPQQLPSPIAFPSSASENKPSSPKVNQPYI